MFKKAALCQKQLEDPDLQKNVTQLLNHIGKQSSQWNSLVFLRIIQQLTSYSLIDFDQQNNFYIIHPLVQHWSRTTINSNQYHMQKCILTIIGLSISWEFKTEDYEYRQSLLQHITNCMILLRPEDINLSIASEVALVYDEQGQWGSAEAIEVVVMEKTKQLQGDKHPDTLTHMANLASTYRNQGHWKEAEALQVVIMEKRKQLLGHEHPSILRSMANLAATYRNQGHWKKAEALQVVVMEKTKQLLGHEHPSTLASMANLASTYRNQGHWKEAEALQVVVIEKRKQVLGPEHPDTLKAMESLICTYRDQGHLEEMEVLETLVKEIHKTTNGL